jgi:O-antigen ligase
MSTQSLPLATGTRTAHVTELALTVAVAAGLGAMLGDGVGWRVGLALAAIASLAVLGLFHPLGFLLAFLLLRPMLDGMAETRFHTPVGSLNVAGLLALVVIWTTVAAVTAQQRVMRPPALRAFGFVLVVSALAALLALARYHAVVGTLPVTEVVRLVTLVSVYILAANVVRSERGAWLVVVAAGLSAVAPALIAVIEWLRGVPRASDLTISRVQATFSGPNALGMYLGLAAIVLVALPPGALPRWMRRIALALVLVALVGTFSRSGWVMAALGGTALAWRGHRRLVLGALVVAVLLVLVVPSIRGRVVPGAGTTTAHSSRWIPSSYQWRIDTWKTMARVYAKKPLTGYGLRTAPYVDPRKGPSATAVGYDPHETVIKLLVEGGPLLLLAWTALLYGLVRSMRRLSRSRRATRDVARLAVVLWGVTIFVGLTADDPLAGTALLYALFSVTGAAAGAALWLRASERTAASAAAQALSE